MYLRETSIGTRGRRGWQGVLLLLVSIFVGIQAQSSGFISIDCGSTYYRDPVTTFYWEGDDNYISTGMSGTVSTAVNSTLDNSEALKTFRYFADRQSKHCYELPTTRNISFLLRAMFLQGSSPELTLPIKFDVAVNGTTVFPVEYNIGDSSSTLGTPIVYEGIFYSSGNLTYFCLVPDTGVPFISSLELREFDAEGTMYSLIFNRSNSYVEKKWRINCGAQFGSPNLRYPDDPFDRLWQTPGDGLSGSFESSTGSVTPTTDANPGANYVPQKVMQDAWVNDTANSSFGVNFPVTEGSGVAFTQAVIFYLQEIESNASRFGRMFNLALSEGPILQDIILANGRIVTAVALHLLTDIDWVNFTAVALPNSILGPIVNAIEIYAQLPFNDSATAAKDVDSLESLQSSFNLRDWQGDPCYPVSWDWVSCTGDTSARVQKLLLSGMGIDASIPSTISDLDALTEINLSHNNLYGTIPDSLASLQNLVVLDLSDNNLSGEVPANLVRKLGSNFSYSGNVLLDHVKKTNHFPLIISATAAGGAGLGIVVGILISHFCSKKKTPKPPRKLDTVEMGISARQTTSRSSPSPQFQYVDNLRPQQQVTKTCPEGAGHVSYETVRIATDNFKDKIEEGSYGSVYHGWLNDREVAVKVNDANSQQGQNEFAAEVDILTRVHHRNLVSLIGFCSEGSQHILIYEFQVNGTLQEWLDDGGKNRGILNWKARLQIALDAATGLDYLHKGCDPTIVHRDIKSTNILLDENMTAKVADFGLSKSTNWDTSIGYSTDVKGTRGYLDPEYQKLGRLTHKSDLYSFGVVLAEILTGRSPFEMQPGGGVVLLVESVQKLVDRNDIEALADPILQGAFNPESMWRMVDILLSCIDPVGARRPDIMEVVTGITEAIELENTSTASHVPGSTSYFIS